MSIKNDDSFGFASIEDRYLEAINDDIVFCQCEQCKNDIMMGETYIVTGDNFNIHEDCFEKYFFKDCYKEIAEQQ